MHIYVHNILQDFRVGAGEIVVFYLRSRFIFLTGAVAVLNLAGFETLLLPYLKTKNRKGRPGKQRLRSTECHL